MESNQLTSSKSGKKLEYGFTAKEVVSFVDSLEIIQSDNLDDVRSTVNIGLAQIAFRSYNSLPDYIREMNMIVAKAIDQRAHIVCFPEFAGLLPATLFPQAERVLKSYNEDPISKLPGSMWIYQAAVGMASECFEVFFATMSALAAAHRIYIVAGSTIYPERGAFNHRSLVFSPLGGLMGYQGKLSSGYIERALQIDEANTIEVFETSVGKIAVVIGSDIDYFEVSRAIYSKGVRIIINPSTYLAPHTNIKASLGANLRAQENPLFIAQPTIVGTLPVNNITLEGATGIFAPDYFSYPGAKNVMYESTIKHQQTQVITPKLDLDEIERLEKANKEQRNKEFLERYIDYLY